MSQVASRIMCHLGSVGRYVAATMRAHVSSAASGIVFTTALVLATAAPVCAQRIIHLSSTPTCSKCKIQLTRVAVLGQDEGEAAVGPSGIVERDSRGRYYVVHMFAPYQVLLFDSTGAFVKAVGREGDGPGEYRMVSSVVIAAGDTLHLFDGGTLRHTVLSPDFDVVRTSTMEVRPGYDGVSLLSDGALLVQAIHPTAQSVGYPLHLLDSDGKFVRSFGTDDPDVGPQNMYIKTVRILNAAPKDRVWISRWHEYVVELWGRDAIKYTEIRRAGPWFRDNSRTWDGKSPPTAEMCGVWEDPYRRLWILVRVPGARWRDVPKVGGEEGGFSYDPSEWTSAYDTMIDVVDLQSGRLLVSEKVDPAAVLFTHDGLMPSYRETDAGYPRIDVWHAALITPSRNLNRPAQTTAGYSRLRERSRDAASALAPRAEAHSGTEPAS